MKDLFGEDSEPVEKKDVAHKSKYQLFKSKNKYRRSYHPTMKCKTCPFHECYEYHNKNYHKCQKLGYSMGEATDIRLSFVCDLHPAVIEFRKQREIDNKNPKQYKAIVKLMTQKEINKIVK